MKFKQFLILLILDLLLIRNLLSQEKLYSNTFSLSEVSLLEGSFKHARDLNISTLLQYDADRRLAPFHKVAKLQVKAENYPNWESDGLDGYIGGITCQLWLFIMHPQGVANVCKGRKFLLGNGCRQGCCFLTCSPFALLFRLKNKR